MDKLTLHELTLRSGFSKRQIRYYITQKLVPGAGAQRGPKAVYGEETLYRLQAIARMKDCPVGPTERTMTLAEIRHALDNAGPVDGGMEDATLSAPMMLRSPDLMGEPELPAQESSALEFLNLSVREDRGPVYQEHFGEARSLVVGHVSASASELTSEQPLDDILRSLHSLLMELGSDTRLAKTVGQGESWQRLTSPDVEFQVRIPDSHKARRRLNRMAAQLGRLLAREE